MLGYPLPPGKSDVPDSCHQRDLLYYPAVHYVRVQLVRCHRAEQTHVSDGLSGTVLLLLPKSGEGHCHRHPAGGALHAVIGVDSSQYLFMVAGAKILSTCVMKDFGLNIFASMPNTSYPTCFCFGEL